MSVVIGSLVTVLDDEDPPGIVQTHVTHVWSYSKRMRLSPAFSVDTFSTRGGEEGTHWIHGHFTKDSTEGRALLAAYALATGEAQRCRHT